MGGGKAVLTQKEDGMHTAKNTATAKNTTNHNNTTKQRDLQQTVLQNEVSPWSTKGTV